MSDRPSVTAIIPTFNRAHLICDALDSIAAQTYPVAQIVVVDDGSNDNTQSVVTRWSERTGADVQYIRQDNAGGNVARNTGIKAAMGDLVGFLDSDDLWAVNKLEKQVAVFAAQPALGAIYCGVREVAVGNDQPSDYATRNYPQGQLLAQLLVADVTAPTSTYLIRREVFDTAGGFDTDLKARQDWDMWIRIAEGHLIGAVAEPLVDLRDHDGPRTVSDPTRELAAYRAILSKYAHLRAALPFANRQAAIAAYHRRAGRVHYHHMNKPMAAIGHHLRAIANWPFVPDSYAALVGVFLPSGIRQKLHKSWNVVFGRTILAIRSH